MVAKLIRDSFPELNHPDLLSEIEKVGSVVQVKPDEVLMEVGKYIQFMPLVIHGVIKIIRRDEEGNEILLYYLEGGKTCAMSMSCCLQTVKSNIKATVIEEAQMILIPVKYVDEWMSKYTGWKNFIMNTYTTRFDQLLHAIDVIAFKKMDERLLVYLQEKIHSIQEDFVFSTHREIASELNTSREVVSRMLKKLEIEDQIKVIKGKIYLV